ncbi:deazapurine DNA modification protein DpdA family protein [Actinophytocola sediminis]
MVAFLLGTHQPGWLARAGVPLFVSDVRLRAYKTLPRAVASWALDSGGFSELQYHGRWTVTPEEYVARVRRYRDEIGHLLWAAPQDSMCEPPIIYGGQYGREKFVGTRQFLDPGRRLSHEDLIRLHLMMTVANYATLVRLDPTLPWVPVVQGWRVKHYLLCVDLYRELAGIDLATMPLVGVGSVCRRQNTSEAGEILAALRDRGLTRLHGFGFKLQGLEQHRRLLASADSMAWSDTARKHHRRAIKLELAHGLMPGCEPGPHHPAQNCANCLPFSLRWRTTARAAAAATRTGRSASQPQSRDVRQLALWNTTGDAA